MAKLIVRDVSYQTVSSTAFFETEYEDLIVNRAPLLFPEFLVVPFKLAVHSEHGTARADLALIDHSYRRWWVVEVEMSHHSLNAHVLPQVEKLANAAYGADVAAYFAARSPMLNQAALQEMLKGAQPQVLVVVNNWMPDWLPGLMMFGAQLAVVEVFRSEKNEHVFRLNGNYPTGLGNLLSELRTEPTMPRLIALESPAGIGFDADGRLALEFHGETTEWTRVAVANKVWITPLRENPLDPDKRYVVVRKDDGSLAIRSARKGF